jgi:hypothetical protein
LAAQAPWLDDPTPPPGEGAWAISIPPETPEEAAEDAAFEAAWAARPKAETTSRVVTGSPERHGGLAMIALVVHEDATSLYFHFVGERAPVDAPGRHSMRAFDDALDALVPPALRDDRGVAYEPVEPRPISASSHSSEPDSDPGESSSAHGSTRPRRPTTRPHSTSSKRTDAGRFPQPPRAGPPLKRPSSPRADDQSTSAKVDSRLPFA